MKNRGFTLIELLVVVAIIGILAAIALPKLFSAICTSKIGQVDGVMGSINGSLSMYFADNTGSYPSSAATNVSTYIVTKYMSQAPTTPWSKSYNYSGSNSQYTLCVTVDGGNGCDGTTATGGNDNYRYYGSASGKVGSNDAAQTGCL